MIDPRTPCIVGVARMTWHPEAVGEMGAPEPIAMWEHVARAAAVDAGHSDLAAAVDAIEIVYCQTWQYDDAVARLVERLDADPRRRHYSGIGGTTGQQLVSATAARMLRGELDSALIVSAEALATQRSYKKRGEWAPYSFKPDEKRPFPWESPPHPVEVAHEVFQAWLTFAIFDNARRAQRGEDLDAYRRGIGEMMAPMTTIAAANPDAWFRVERSVDDLVTVRPDNRMVGYPYTKYLVSVMDVDMAAAVLMTTHARADALGVPPDRRVYPRGWCYATDPVLVAERPDMGRSPAMTGASSAALRAAGLGVDDIACFDLYSCFGSSLHFACDALGLAPLDERGLTVTGGLPYHGGPASGYVVHSIAKMTDRLRADPGSYGLVSGVGMHMTKHAFGVYSTVPGPVEIADAAAVQADLDGLAPVSIVAEHDGDAVVAAYSVIHGRDGAPEAGVLVCDVGAGARTYARVQDSDLCLDAEARELVGTNVRLAPTTRSGPMGEARVNIATW
ncbi:MAG: acetyl-CoA synthetase [Actinomycetota bacterium]